MPHYALQFYKFYSFFLFCLRSELKTILKTSCQAAVLKSLLEDWETPAVSQLRLLYYSFSLINLNFIFDSIRFNDNTMLVGYSRRIYVQLLVIGSCGANNNVHQITSPPFSFNICKERVKNNDVKRTSIVPSMM